MIFSGGFRTPYTWLAALVVFGSLLTVAYALWFAGRVFFGEPKALPEDGIRSRALPLAMVAPTVLLAVLVLVEGLFPGPVFGWVDQELALILGGGW
jgi:NADH:ubiquinone oxidoreductase subunit 4 (subunit M)